ncbi:MAG: aminodeoxychorismate/anthranilate synthase component II [Aigarchaeota archaeon]|nr:aminodeoxychorismate/anthranilate synthase component II [Aigarchaeota archaeon]MDW8092525.1 aminodeoxychorismate/anthranilate synthase component II [Nitrososphaerota archaeon]
MKILVIDNYDSFVYNIAQYLGELGAQVLVYRNDALTLEEVIAMDVDGIVVSPGPGHPSSRRSFGISGDIIAELGESTPVLGVCLGHQGIAVVFGGTVERASRIMHGKTSTVAHDGEGIFEGVRQPLKVTRYHSLVIKKVPECLRVTAHSLDDGEVMGVRHMRYPIEGVQFHPESVLTVDGHKMLRNFLRMCRR